MKHVDSLKRLESVADLDNLLSRSAADRNLSIPTIIVPAGTCGQATGANDLIRIAKKELLVKGLIGKLKLRITGCHGCCQMEPSVLTEPGGVFYPKVGMDGMARIINATARGEVCEDLLYKDSATGRPVPKQNDIPFFAQQTRTLLSRNEQVDPIRISSYLESGGYSALLKVLAKGDAKWVIEEIKASGLRGRGGAGFPTGLKWEMLAKQKSDRGKFLVCNADEGDPGAYMNRTVLEGNPHSIIEGMLIGAYATGATEGVVYVRNEYPLAIKHLVIALRQARDLGLLGTNILGTGFSFDVKMVRGAGAFVCGEETALIRSIEGKMGEPRQRPPFPVQKGIDGKPTAINNVETWADVSLVINNGASRFAKVGTAKNSGTKIFSLVGKVKDTGLVEVPMGISIAKIVYDIGGGPVGKARIKAIQTGGPSGGCIPADKFDLQIDYEGLNQAGSIMGSGGMIVMDENTCMVDLAKYFTSFLKDESCGKCFTCRKGTQRLWEMLDDISRGKGMLAHLDLLEELAVVVKDTTMCGLGQTAPNPALSTLRYFRQEYIRHIWDKKCDAFVCKQLVGAPCQSACPVGTEAWRYIALAQTGKYAEAYRVIREANPFPSVCARVCSHPCESRCKSGATGNQPVAIRALKRFVVDRVESRVFKQATPKKNSSAAKVAVVGAGPAGLTAAHYLSLAGHRVTVLEKEKQAGGMLVAGIPAYRLPRETLRREISLLLNENVSLKCGSSLGKDFTIDSLFKDGFKAVFLAIGAHGNQLLNLPGEDLAGVVQATEFLKAFNLHGKRKAEGYVGIIGGGNAAIDAARVAVRFGDVKNVQILYRRSRSDMPAFEEEIEAALKEGVKLETFFSPVKILGKNGKLTGVECVKNRPGKPDSSGRPKPVPVPGSNFVVPLDTLIVAVGEQPDTEALASMRIGIGERGVVKTDVEIFTTNRPGVFAGGDLATGPSTVIAAIAAGKKAATLITRYLRGEKLRQPGEVRLPEVYIEPAAVTEEERRQSRRAEPPTTAVESRKHGLDEVELALSPEEAARECRRCLRCDLDFTRPKTDATPSLSSEAKQT